MRIAVGACMSREEYVSATNGAEVRRKPPVNLEATQTTPHEMTVAAIIPLYNGAPFIREALESVLSQTEPADEIIVVDDGSTDDGAGAAIVREMAKTYPIRLLTKENGGQGSARNLGIVESNCSHIALLDQDDVWHSDHLAVLKGPFLEGQVRDLGLVYANLDQIDRQGRMVLRRCLDVVPSIHPKRSIFQCLEHDMYILPGASMFTREAWDKAGRFDERLAGYEDDDLFLRMFTAGFDNIYLRDHTVTKWRIYSGSTSFSPRMSKSRMIYFHKLIEAYPNDPRLNLYWGRDAIGPRFFKILYSEFIEGSRLGDSPRTTKAWSDIQEVLPVMPRGVRRRMALVAPLIGALYQGPLRSQARSLFRWAARIKRR